MASTLSSLLSTGTESDAEHSRTARTYFGLSWGQRSNRLVTAYAAGRAGLAGSHPCEIEKMMRGMQGGSEFGALGFDGERKTGQDVRTQNGSIGFCLIVSFKKIQNCVGSQ